MALSRGQFTNVISKGKKMAYKNPTGPQKFDKKNDFMNLMSKLKGMGNKEVPKVKRSIGNIIKSKKKFKT